MGSTGVHRERPILFSAPMVRAILDGRKTQTRRPQRTRRDGATHWTTVPCPYGQPGDRLWMREAFAIVPRTAYLHSDDDGKPLPHRLSPDGTSWAVYKTGWIRCRPGMWRPSIHMPRWASRITLEVVHVRATLLQHIAERDAEAEGFWGKSPVKEFAAAWDKLNAKHDYSWESNPWVWVVEFNRLEGET